MAQMPKPESDAKLIKYATISWSTSDVQTLFDVTDVEAEQFLCRHERHLQDEMISRGWDVLEELGARAGFRRYQEEDD